MEDVTLSDLDGLDRPLFIIGAGRSGTNILRDCLTAMPGWKTWNCDEINLIMRHGNKRKPHDVFDAQDARPPVAKYIRHQFTALGQRTGANMIVEKTCANSLRIAFLNAIFPKARFLVIVRDGRDVALSAAVRWASPPELGYLAKKVRFIPPLDLPYYGVRFIQNRLHQFRNIEKRQAIWGPIFPGMCKWSRDRPLIEICARQWVETVSHSLEALKTIPQERQHLISYETLVDAPDQTLKEILQWLDAKADPALVLAAGQAIRKPVHSWRDQSDTVSPQAHALMFDMLERLGYETAT